MTKTWGQILSPWRQAIDTGIFSEKFPFCSIQEKKFVCNNLIYEIFLGPKLKFQKKKCIKDDSTVSNALVWSTIIDKPGIL